MARLIIKSGRILDNITKLNDYLENNEIKWSLIVKSLCGHKEALKAILTDPVIKRIDSIGDSRLSSLKAVKEIDPTLETLYIKPPAIQNVKSVIKYADGSLNSSLDTIKALSAEAVRQNKKHKVIIMIEMGELREGIMRDNIMSFYEQVFNLENIEITGLGTNLGCMYGIEPTYDKLIQLSLYKLLLEEKFKRKIPFISGGSSITLPLISKNKVPPEVNHFRIGEAAIFGTSPLNNKKYRNLSDETFEYQANIIEMELKEYMPDGVVCEAAVGHIAEHDSSVDIMESYKAIVDFGILDVDYNTLAPKDKKIKFVGTTSDLTVYDLGTNEKVKGRKRYDVGKVLTFKPNYMGVARLMNSKFIDKMVE